MYIRLRWWKPLTSMRKTSIMLEFYIFADLYLLMLEFTKNFHDTWTLTKLQIITLLCWHICMFGLLIKEKKKKNETDFQGMSCPFQKKNWLSQLISQTWMKKLVKVFKNLMSVICYMCTSSVVYMQSPTASLILSHPNVDMLDRADVLDALFVPSWHLWWPIAASFWGEGPSQCSSYTAVCKEENSGIASLWAPRGHMTHSVAFTSVACRSSALDVLVFLLGFVGI